MIHIMYSNGDGCFSILCVLTEILLLILLWKNKNSFPEMCNILHQISSEIIQKAEAHAKKKLSFCAKKIIFLPTLMYLCIFTSFREEKQD